MALNISTVNYTPNITDGSLASGQTQGGMATITVPGNLSSKEAGIVLLQNLNPGDVLTGEITDINGNRITISLSDTVSFTATLSNALSYNIGETASFSIKDNSGEQIVLKSINSENIKNLMNDQTVRNAIRSAGLALNDTTVSLVHNLMKQNLPIDSNTLNTYARMLESVPQATPEDVVLLSKMDIPVSEENVTAFHDYYNFNEGINDHAAALSSDITNLLNELADKSFGQTASFINTFVNSYSEPISVAENMAEIMEPEQLAELAEDIKNLATTGNDEEIPPSFNRAVLKTVSGNLTAKEFLNTLSGLIENEVINKDTLKNLMGKSEFGQIVDSFVRQQLFIKPEDVSADSLKRLYGKILQDSKNISDKLGDNPKMATILQSNTAISNEVNLLNNISHFMSFVQIPLKMAEQNTHGDLYVYSKKGALDKKDEIKALLHLDMDNLGSMDIFVTLHNKNVTTNFKVETEEILDYIESHMDELSAALNKTGYNLTSDIALNDTPYTFKTAVIESELPPTEIKRFSFDVRA